MKTNSGFTIVELMVVVAVVAVIATFAIPGMRVFLANANIRGTAEEIRSGMELARSEALRRNAVTAFAIDGSSWRIFVPAGNADGSDLTVVSRPAKQTTMTVAANVVQIQFGGSGWATPFGSAMTVRLSDTAAGQCKPTGGVNCLNVTVTAGGLVRSCDPTAAAGSVTACS